MEAVWRWLHVAHVKELSPSKTHLTISWLVFVFADSADNWNLAKPLQRCSLQVQQKGHQVLLIFMTQKESEQVLFAHCTIDLSDSSKSLAEYFEPVLDSTRYFVIHITDEASDRKAHVGIGFRERDDANHLKEILEDYAQAMRE